MSRPSLARTVARGAAADAARLAPFAPLAAAALWGGMYVVSKWGFDAVPPVTLAFLRVAVAAPVLLAIVRVRAPERSFSRRDRRRFALLGVWVAVTLATQFLGTDMTNASQGSLLTVLTPVVTLALGVALLDESLSARKVGGTALAGAGTLLVLAGQYDPAALVAGEGAAAGVGLLVAASVGWAAYTVQGAPLVRRYSALETATYSTVVAVPLLALLVPVELAVRGVDAGAATLPLAGAVLYLGVASTAVAWYLWYKGLEYADAGTVAAFFFAQPVVGTALGVALLGESVGTGFLLGGAVLCAGIYVVSTARTDP